MTYNKMKGIHFAFGNLNLINQFYILFIFVCLLSWRHTNAEALAKQGKSVCLHGRIIASSSSAQLQQSYLRKYSKYFV